MSAHPTQADRFRRVWHNGPIARSPRPWLPTALALACAALVIAGSLGPWLYIETGPEWDIEITQLAGTGTDGVFSLFFALLAIVALLVTLARPDLWVFAWGAVGAMALCSMVGLFDWVIFDPMSLAHQPGQQITLVRVEWGLKLLTGAAPLGTLGTILIARALMRGDY